MPTHAHACPRMPTLNENETAVRGEARPAQRYISYSYLSVEYLAAPLDLSLDLGLSLVNPCRCLFPFPCRE